MRVVFLDSAVPSDLRDAVVAIGNFDAVHKGHRILLQRAKDLAAKLGRPFGVLTFEPHPRRLFRPDDPPFRVSPPPVKLWRLDQDSPDAVFVLPFTLETAQLSAEDFIKDILQKRLGTRAVVVGSDFHFGKARMGNAALLQQNGFVCESLDLVKDPHSAVYSASRVRGLLQSGHIDEANNLLGWEWEIWGTVEKGDQRGRELGYPTANVPLGETIHPAYGVYAALVSADDGATWHKSATNIGIRPMFEARVALVEAHILDFQGDLYSKTLRIRPVQKIRDEEKFGSLDALIIQIAKDCEKAREILAKTPISA